MNKKILLIPLAVLLLSAMIAPALAQKELVGVQVGDWFKYKAQVTQWESTMEFLEPGYIGPLSLYENETNAIWYNVTAITPDTEGDNVTFTIQYDWKNGSVTTATMIETISTADQTIFMIGANMTPGDMVSDTYDFLGLGVDYPARYIDETIDLVNPNATRATNVCNYTFLISSLPITTTYSSGTKQLGCVFITKTTESYLTLILGRVHNPRTHTLLNGRL